MYSNQHVLAFSSVFSSFSSVNFVNLDLVFGVIMLLHCSVCCCQALEHCILGDCIVEVLGNISSSDSSWLCWGLIFWVLFTCLFIFFWPDLISSNWSMMIIFITVQFLCPISRYKYLNHWKICSYSSESAYFCKISGFIGRHIWYVNYWVK